MRKNLRLDWRALALLGALLTIIIDWPGLAYAMPTIFPPVSATEATAAALDTINVIKNDKIFSSFPIKHVNDDSDDQNDERDDDQNHFTQKIEFKKETTTFSYSKEERTNNMETEMEQKRLTITAKQEVNEINNSISHNNHKNNQKNQESIQQTAIHQFPQNSTEKEAETEKGEEEDSPEATTVSSINTHIENSTINNKINSTNKEPETTTFKTTTESSAKIPSTLIPPSTTITDDQDLDQDSDQDQNPTQDLVNHKETNNTNGDLISPFKFSSSHHLAILSRTERSLRSSSRNETSLPSAAAGGGGGMVRRSSDMSVMKSKRLNNSRNLHNKNNLDRNERSTVSHLSGPSRKIQLYIKNRFIQLMPDGTVNGTQDEQCEYTILQRSTVDVGRIKIQGVATCLYLCMDPCGAVYGSKDFTDDCVFNESMEQHNYNTYSSTYNSNSRRKYYLALNRHGEPRKLQIPPTRSLGKLATYTNAITEAVPQERVEQLIAKNFGANRIKHGIRQLCDTGKPLIELIDSKNFKARPKCNPNSSSSTNSNSVTKSSSSSSSSSNLSSFVNSSSSNSGQLLNNVPAANDKNSLSNSNSSSNSGSNSSSSSRSSTSSSFSIPATNSSSSSQTSISYSQNNGHISSSINSSSTTNSSCNSSSNSSSNSRTSSDHRVGGKKKQKKPKCRPWENEEEHNCKTSLKRPQNLKLGPKKCRELIQQQQQAGVTDIVIPPACNKNKGPKKQKGAKRTPGKNGLGTDGLGPNNRRGKKLNLNAAGGSGGRQAAKPNQNNGGGTAAGSKKKQNKPKRGGGGGGNNNNKRKLKTTTSTTEKTSPTTLSSSTSTLRPKFWETTSLVPSTTIYDNYDPHAETTSDRGDREQRNVRYSNSMEDSLEQSSEDTSAAEDQEDDDNDMDNNEDNEDASYEDDTFIASSSHIPHQAAAETSHTPLTGGADDFLYYDQLDFLPMGLWEFIAVLWIYAWSLQTFS